EVAVPVGGSCTEPVTLRAQWVLGCDGLHSTVRRLAGLDGGRWPRGDGRLTGERRAPGGHRAADERYGLRRHFRIAPWTDLVEVHWAPYAEAYVTPVGDDLVGVALLAARGRLRGGFDA